MVIVQVLSYLPAATLMSCVGLLILEPAAARAASDMARFRGRLAEAHARTEVAGIEPVARSFGAASCGCWPARLFPGH